MNRSETPQNTPLAAFHHLLRCQAEGPRLFKVGSQGSQDSLSRPTKPQPSLEVYIFHGSETAQTRGGGIEATT